MYRRKLETLPPDFTFPKTLEGLGYFINDRDEVRMIADPELPFHYQASKNERFLDMQKAAMNECLIGIVMERAAKLGMVKSRLPVNTQDHEPHVPILCSENLERAKRVIFYFGGVEELGILSGRIMSLQSLDAGSIVGIVRDTLASRPGLRSESESGSESSTPTGVVPPEVDVALVIANPGQLVWYRRGKRAVSIDGWRMLPRPSAVHEAMQMTKANRIPRNGSPAQHARCMFEDVIEPLIKRGAKINVVANSSSIDDVVRVLDAEWPRFKDGMEAIVGVCANPYGLEKHDEGFTDWWGRRARIYISSQKPAGTPMTGRQVVDCNVYSSGVSSFSESIVPRAWKVFLDYFKLVARHETYENIPQDIPVEDIEEELWDNSDCIPIVPPEKERSHEDESASVGV